VAHRITLSQARQYQNEVDTYRLNSGQLHDVASRIFRDAGCRVFSEYHGANTTPVAISDLVVWHDSLDAQRGAPIVVEILARTDVTGALIPRLRRTRQAAGVRTLLALSSGRDRTHVVVEGDGGVIVQATFKALLDLLVSQDLNEALKALTAQASR
jgi:hypothetical protein